MKNPTPIVDPTKVCHRGGHWCIDPVQNLTGWEGRHLAIERCRFYCADVEVCIARRLVAA